MSFAGIGKVASTFHDYMAGMTTMLMLGNRHTCTLSYSSQSALERGVCVGNHVVQIINESEAE